MVFDNNVLAQQEIVFAEDDIYLSDSYKFLQNKMLSKSDRIRPDYIIEWIKTDVMTKEKSIILIEMDISASPRAPVPKGSLP